MSEKVPTSSSLPDTLPPPPPDVPDAPFTDFQRRMKTERPPSGRVPPTPPEWMQKPLKPPRALLPSDV
jgi:hypothetical protein